jgi:hypothetical protein
MAGHARPASLRPLADVAPTSKYRGMAAWPVS